MRWSMTSYLAGVNLKFVLGWIFGITKCIIIWVKSRKYSFLDTWSIVTKYLSFVISHEIKITNSLCSSYRGLTRGHQVVIIPCTHHISMVYASISCNKCVQFLLSDWPSRFLLAAHVNLRVVIYMLASGTHSYYCVLLLQLLSLLVCVHTSGRNTTNWEFVQKFKKIYAWKEIIGSIIRGSSGSVCAISGHRSVKSFRFSLCFVNNFIFWLISWTPGFWFVFWSNLLETKHKHRSVSWRHPVLFIPRCCHFAFTSGILGM